MYKIFLKALLKLQQYILEDNGTDINKLGILHTFEFTFDIYIKLLQEYILKLDKLEQCSPSDVIRKAFELKIINNDQKNMEMLKNRNLVIYTYEEDLADDIYIKVKTEYINLFLDFKDNINDKIIII